MDFKAFIFLGTFLMAVVMMIARTSYRIPAYKVLLSAVFLALAGIAGAKLMAFIESGNWGGRSFYGAVFFAPFAMMLFAVLLRMNGLELLDLCAPAECIMLALLKVNCYVDGCCYGTIIKISKSGELIRFPSQIVECVSALVIMMILLWMIRKQTFRRTVYAWYMVIYGVTRFVLNLLRDTEPFVWKLPAGNFWSLISVIIGACMILLIRRSKSAGAEEI